MSCDTIEIGSEADCTALPQAGTKARAVVMNYDQVSGYTLGPDGNVTSITLVPGAVAYEFFGFRNDIKNAMEIIRPDIGVTEFKHMFGMTIYERTQQQKNNVEALARGLYVVIVENKGLDDSSFEVLGLGVGMEIDAGPIRNAHENGGYFVMAFSTPEDGA